MQVLLNRLPMRLSISTSTNDYEVLACAGQYREPLDILAVMIFTKMLASLPPPPNVTMTSF